MFSSRLQHTAAQQTSETARDIAKVDRLCNKDSAEDTSTQAMKDTQLDLQRWLSRYVQAQVWLTELTQAAYHFL